MSTRKKQKSLFGQRLTELRKEKGLTQPQLAEELGLTRDIIAYYESKSTNPTSEFVQKIADYFSVSVDELVRDIDIHPIKPGPKSQLEKRFDRLKKIPRSQQKVVLTVLDGLLETLPGT